MIDQNAIVEMEEFLPVSDVTNNGISVHSTRHCKHTEVSRNKKTCINILTFPFHSRYQNPSCLKPKSVQQTIRIRLIKLRRWRFLLLFLLLLFLLRICLLLKWRRLNFSFLELSDR